MLNLITALIAQSTAYRWHAHNSVLALCLLHLTQHLILEFRNAASALGAKLHIENQLGFLNRFASKECLRSSKVDALFSNFMNSFSSYSNDGLVAHIRQHLKYLLNTRQDSVSHLSDYGLADLPQLLLTLPQSEYEVRHTIHELITRFEPRLSQLRIESVATKEDDTLLTLRIMGMLLQQHAVEFTVRFTQCGQVILE